MTFNIFEVLFFLEKNMFKYLNGSDGLLPRLERDHNGLFAYPGPRGAYRGTTHNVGHSLLLSAMASQPPLKPQDKADT